MIRATDPGPQGSNCPQILVRLPEFETVNTLTKALLNSPNHDPRICGHPSAPLPRSSASPAWATSRGPAQGCRCGVEGPYVEGSLCALSDSEVPESLGKDRQVPKAPKGFRVTSWR